MASTSAHSVRATSDAVRSSHRAASACSASGPAPSSTSTSSRGGTAMRCSHAAVEQCEGKAAKVDSAASAASSAHVLPMLPICSRFVVDEHGSAVCLG